MVFVAASTFVNRPSNVMSEADGALVRGRFWPPGAGAWPAFWCPAVSDGRDEETQTNHQTNFSFHWNTPFIFAIAHLQARSMPKTRDTGTY
jgi:hypothetical protein